MADSSSPGRIGTGYVQVDGGTAFPTFRFVNPARSAGFNYRQPSLQKVLKQLLSFERLNEWNIRLC
jgi:hypothetical protein